MIKVTLTQEVRDRVKQWRKENKRVAFVPTMGNLHAGHLKLITEAKKSADKVVVSIFVNPTQFGEDEDFTRYPRTEAEDEEKLISVATDMLFLPAVETMYTDDAATVISVNGLDALHCGASRLGHFDGVATIVNKFFNIVQPDVAFFGEKDFQQLMLIKKMVRDLDVPVEIFAVATEREHDGLALSSRNGFLTNQERLVAPELYRSLCRAKENVLLVNLGLRAIEQEEQQRLKSLGFEVDYFSICNAMNLQLANEKKDNLVILVAAKLGKPRLIDNIPISR